tara:strand:+ start:619 stop:879 length:261 start_codon:yes stop_codon:yes gene_type:complete
MEGIESHLIDIGMTLLGSALIGLIGFVWKISHRVAANEKKAEELQKLHHREYQQIQRDIDMIISKVDKQGEWTTNRMMSIAKEMPR